MKNKNFTLAIYGIQDISDSNHPVYIHDHNITLYRNGQIVKHLSLERYTGIKYDSRMPAYLYTLLKREKLLGLKGMDLVFVDHFIGRAFISREGNLRFEAPCSAHLSEIPEEGMGYFLEKKTKAYVVNHELAHVFSNLPFYGPFMENSLHVHFDGGASKSNFSAWIFRNGQMKLLEYHWDLLQLSSFFNANALAFSIVGAKQEDQHSMPGKFMGYAAYGNYKSNIEHWLRENNFFADIWGHKSVFFDRVKQDWNIDLHSFDQNNTFLQDVAATFQHIFQRALLNKMKNLQETTGSSYLYYTGGTALNIKANAALVRSGMFKKVFIPPCTNDSGLSIGAGAFMEWNKHGEISKHNPYLNSWFINSSRINYSEEEIIRIAVLLAQGEVVAVVNGYGESGPRALGNRSILARADSLELARYVSQGLKQREWYRPVAPVMLGKYLRDFVQASNSSEISKYMLMDFNIRRDKIHELEGVVHVDGTSRIQTITTRSDNPFLFDLLTMLDEQYSIRALLNTSFNSKGKPLVHSAKTGFEEARNMGIKYLVVNGELREIRY